MYKTVTLQHHRAIIRNSTFLTTLLQLKASRIEVLQLQRLKNQITEERKIRRCKWEGILNYASSFHREAGRKKPLGGSIVVTKIIFKKVWNIMGRCEVDACGL